MKKGDIYFINIDDHKGSEQGGFRPVLILKEVVGSVVVALMTTKKKKKLPVHIDIHKEYTGLEKDSVVLLEQIQILNKDKFTKIKPATYLVDSAKWREIEQGLRVSLGL